MNLGHAFSDQELLRQALTHRSAGPGHNERLEFLGDALLGMLVADFLYRRFPDADEGQLTRTRAALVRRETLAGIARRVELGESLILGEGEQKSGGWRRASILANAVEALIGAVYLDAGIDACRTFVETLFSDELAEVDPATAGKDPKTALQEYLQSRSLPLPEYTTTAIAGPPHHQVFTVTCSAGTDGIVVDASGNSRRKAEQAAARAMLRHLTAS